MPDYLIHKAVDLVKVNKVRRAVLSQSGYLDRTYMGQAKYDGCNVIFILTVVGEQDKVLSRTGEAVSSMYWLLPYMHKVFAHLVMELGGAVILGEAWKKGVPFSEISGRFRKKSVDADLGVRVFDVLSLAEYDVGVSNVPYIERYAQVISGNYETQPMDIRPACTHFVPSTAGHSKWQGWCNELKALGGYDGLILRDPEGAWMRGNGTNGEIIKLKPALSFDLRVVGLEEGKGKHTGRLGALVVRFHDKELRVGTGFSDAQRDAWWPSECSEIVGSIVEIEAMDFSSDGLLREPRFKGIRHDKLEADDE